MSIPLRESSLLLACHSLPGSYLQHSEHPVLDSSWCQVWKYNDITESGVSISSSFNTSYQVLVLFFNWQWTTRKADTNNTQYMCYLYFPFPWTLKHIFLSANINEIINNLLVRPIHWWSTFFIEKSIMIHSVFKKSSKKTTNTNKNLLTSLINLDW